MTREQLHAELWALANEIDDTEQVPERFALSSTKGCLADIDAEVLRLAASVVHRLMLWEKHPGVSPESYFVPAPEPEPIASRKAPEPTEVIYHHFTSRKAVH